MSITLNGYITVEGPNTALVSGSVSNPTTIVSVEMFDGTDDVGSASINADGTWTFDAFFDPDVSLTAVATNTSKQTETSSPLLITSGDSHGQIAALQQGVANEEVGYVYGPKGRTLYAADLTFSQTAFIEHLDGQSEAPVLYVGPSPLSSGTSISVDIDNFRVAGPRHDVLDLSDSGIQTIADLLQKTTMNNGAATIHIDDHTSVTLDNVTKQQIAASHHDFMFASATPAP